MTSDWRQQAVSPEEALAQVESGMRLFIHGAAATPTPLLDALATRTDLQDVELWHLHTEGRVPFAETRHVGRFRSVSLFTGAALRQPIAEGRADFIPIFLSDIPQLFRSRVQIDVALLQLSPPDRHGLCSLGTSVDIAKAASETARVVVAEINLRMPRTHGNTTVPLTRVDTFIVTDRPLPFGSDEQSLTDVEVVLTDRVSGVLGTVNDADNHPLTGAPVLLYSTDRDRWYPQSRFIRRSQSGADGTYRIAGVPPGSYYIVALPALPADGEGSWEDPDFLEQQLPVASTVTIREAETQSEALKLAR